MSKLLNFTTKLHKYFFYALCFLLPVNLSTGRTFLGDYSYVNGLSVDYLIPSIYLIDIFVFFVLFLYFVQLLIENKLSVFKSIQMFFIPFKKTYPIIFYLFLMLFYVLLLSSILALRPIVAFYAFSRIFLYTLLIFYLYNIFGVLSQHERNLKLQKIFNIFITSALLVSFLGILQFLKQGSIFNNFLFFGEQPYTHSTYGILKENYFGISKIPPYGTFRHPNAFAGYLCIVLSWIVYIILVIKNLKYKYLYTLSLVFLVCTLLLTVSTIALIAFVLFTVILILFVCYKNFLTRLFYYVPLIFIIFVFIITLYPSQILIPFFLLDNISLLRRLSLLSSSYEIFKIAPFFGVGLNNSVVVIEYGLQSFNALRFSQPVHNIFVLFLIETGIFGFTILLSLLFNILIYTFNYNKINYLLFINVLQMLFISSFDHYFFTGIQTQLLFWLTLGFLLAYNNK